MDSKSSLLLILAVLAVPVPALDSGEDASSEISTTTEQEQIFSNTEPIEVTTEDAGSGENKTPFESSTLASSTEDAAEDEGSARVARLSEQVREVLARYRADGVLTLPVPVPDPMVVADIKSSVAGTPIHFTNNTVYGLSNFTVDHINTDLDKMQVFVALHIKRLVMLGNYSMKTFFRKSGGPYNVTLTDVQASGAAEIERDPDGNLQASDSEMDMSFMDSKVDLQQNSMGSFLQGIIASAGPTLFEAIKPAILKEVNTKIRAQVNEKIKSLGNKLPINLNETSPVDKAVAEGRRYVRENGYDPFEVKEKSLVANPVRLSITDFTLSGLSRFYRVGDVGLSMDKGNIQASIHVATKRLYGSCNWNISISDFFTRHGVSHFTIKQLQVRAKVNQSLDVQQSPKLVDLDIFLGPIRLQMDKSENFNFVIEYVVNTMPALIRHIIVDTLEIPLKYKVQEILDKVDVEKLLDERLPELDNYTI